MVETENKYENKFFPNKWKLNWMNSLTSGLLRQQILSAKYDKNYSAFDKKPK